MDWKEMCSAEQLAGIIELSTTRPQVIFKHSTRCSISSMAKGRLERSQQPTTVDFHFLDLIRYRSLSEKIAVDLAVTHESPQVLLIINKECVYEESHNGIEMDELTEQINISRVLP